MFSAGNTYSLRSRAKGIDLFVVPCTGVNHGHSSNRAAWRIVRRRRARSWRTLGYDHHAGNVPPNIGRPLFDDSRVASS